MNYALRRLDDYTLIELSGRVDGPIVVAAGGLVRKMGISSPGTVILDIDGLDEQREMFYHVALINTFKKEVEQKGGILKLRVTSHPILKYLSMTGLKKLFVFDEQPLLMAAEV